MNRFRYLCRTVTVLFLLGSTGCAQDIVPNAVYDGHIDGRAYLAQTSTGVTFYVNYGITAKERAASVRAQDATGTVRVFRGKDVAAVVDRDMLMADVWTPELDRIFAVPVLEDVTNLAGADEHAYLVHRAAFRVVQVLDAKLTVVRTWHGVVSDFLWIADYGGNEPFCIQADGGLVACGEKGEILCYDAAGKVQGRYAIRGLFNEAREVPPTVLDAREERLATLFPGQRAPLVQRHQVDDSLRRQAMAAYDKALPAPTIVAATDLPQPVLVLAALPDGRVLLVDAQWGLFVFDPKQLALTRLVVEGFAPKPKEGFYWARAKGWLLLLKRANQIFAITLEGTPKLLTTWQVPGEDIGNDADFSVHDKDVTLFYGNRKQGKLETLKLLLP